MEGAEPKEIKREKVYVEPGLSTREIMEKYGIAESTALNVRKRGWFVKNYMKKQIIINRDNFNAKAAYNLAGRVFWKNFAYKYDDAKMLKEDLIQEAVTRLFELSGKVSGNEKYNENYSRFYIAHNAMLAFIKTWLKQTRHKRIWKDAFEIIIRDPRLAPLLELG